MIMDERKMKLATRCRYRLSSIAALVSSVFLFAAATSSAEQFPAKPVRLIVQFSPGGGADVNARRLAGQLEALWNQSIVVHNMGGAGGNLANAATASSEPDGYTLLFASLATIVNNPTLYRELTYDADKDLAPVVLVGEVPLVLMVNAKSPAKDVASFIALAKQHPHTMNYGSGGVGTTMHLTGELLKAKAGIDIVHVPFKGANDAFTSIVGGEIQFIFQNVGVATSQLKTGWVKALAITSNQRTKGLPELPTFKESGMPDFQAAITYGIYVAGGTPAPLIAQLNRDINTVLKNPKYVEQMAILGVEVGGGTPQQLADYIAAERKQWVPIIRKLGIVR